MKVALEIADVRHLQNGIWRAVHDERLPRDSKEPLMALYKEIRQQTGWLSEQDQD